MNTYRADLHIHTVLSPCGDLDMSPTRIIEKAREKGIPVIENKPLARAMYRNVEAGSFVPVELYQAIAEVLAMVYQMEKKNKRTI